MSLQQTPLSGQVSTSGEIQNQDVIVVFDLPLVLDNEYLFSSLGYSDSYTHNRLYIETAF